MTTKVAFVRMNDCTSTTGRTASTVSTCLLWWYTASEAAARLAKFGACPESDEDVHMQIRTHFALVLILLVSMALSAPVRAAGSSFGNVKVARSVTVKGFLSCGEWIQNRQVDSPSASAESIWLLGFLAGVAWSNDQITMKDIDRSLVDVWMDNYCQGAPLSTVASGAVILYGELKVKKAP
jgi:hypothetical protein